jgi:hypothetical protein
MPAALRQQVIATSQQQPVTHSRNTRELANGRYEAATTKGGRCKQAGTVYVIHDGVEYLACHRHQAEFKPCRSALQTSAATG